MVTTVTDKKPSEADDLPQIRNVKTIYCPLWNCWTLTHCRRTLADVSMKLDSGRGMDGTVVLKFPHTDPEMDVALSVA